MKKFKLQSVALIIFFVTFLTSCSSDDSKTPDTPKVIYKSAYVTEVTGPTTGKVGKELTYDVAFLIENGCGEFNKMTDVEIKKQPVYQVEAKYPATCDVPAPQIKRTLYKITPALKGTFYLRFAKSETEYIETAVVID